MKKQSSGNKKTYCIDNGLIYAISLNFSENLGKLLENLVYNELQKMGYKEIYFYHNKKECDFIIKSGKKLLPLQVTYQLNTENYEREINGLLTAMQDLSAKNGYIITFDSEEKLINNNIKIIPVWKIYRELVL